MWRMAIVAICLILGTTSALPHLPADTSQEAETIPDITEAEWDEVSSSPNLTEMDLDKSSSSTNITDTELVESSSSTNITDTELVESPSLIANAEPLCYESLSLPNITKAEWPESSSLTNITEMEWPESSSLTNMTEMERDELDAWSELDISPEDYESFELELWNIFKDDESFELEVSNPEDSESFDHAPEMIDAEACPVGTMVDDEECVDDPTYCADPRMMFNGQKCDFDPRNCPNGYTERDGTCERNPEPSRLSLSFDIHFENSVISSPRCRCRLGYHFSQRRGRCIRCRRLRPGLSNCGCYGGIPIFSDHDDDMFW